MKKDSSVNLEAVRSFMKVQTLTPTCCHMASRVPSVGAGMLPLSQRRPRTPAAAGAAEWETNFPSHSPSFPQATTGRTALVSNLTVR